MYNHKQIEKKWQDKWEQGKTFEVKDKSKKEKFYALDMFPYPSAAGLHVGHPEGYTATDILARYKIMNGFNVLHPIGWDAFGLPAENFAIKTGVHPKEKTAENIKTFRRQLKSLGFSYDWSREINTSDPKYYKWTQWLFLQLFKKGLAYKQKAPVNWCDTCKTVLANEQVAGGFCERCKGEVTKRNLEQWFFKITDYIEDLLDGLEDIDWPEPIKLMQQNWIGKSEGVEINFKGVANSIDGDKGKERVDSKEFDINVFTTRPDTIFGVTYVVLAPEHPLVDELVIDEHKDQVAKYRKQVAKMSEIERTSMDREKTGVPIGAFAVNPMTGAKIPIWIADYALYSYGTGAVMAVPAHDQRDFEFAQKFGLEIKQVIAPTQLAEGVDTLVQAYEDVGILVDSREFSGLTSMDAKIKIADLIEAEKIGRRQTNYRLRDWLVSRQRYWGAPIPIIHCQNCGQVPVPEDLLPVELPDDVDFRPTGESPLIESKTFHNVTCPECDGEARREVDTMDTFVDSSWYFLRYCDPNNEQVFADKEKVKYWLGAGSPSRSPGERGEGGVDLYVGGAEHAVLHLLYARFITKVLKDLKLIDFDEPFMHLRNQGLIMGEDGQKMSKSRGNVINPDAVVDEFGADTMRLYEMFMGPFEDQKPWSTKGIVGVRRFLEKVWALEPAKKDVPELEKVLHQTIKKVTADINGFHFNTAISAMMIFVNKARELGVGEKQLGTCLKILSPFAPHLAEEQWEKLGNKKSIAFEQWPEHDETIAKEDKVEFVMQVNNRVRDKIQVSPDITKAEAEKLAFASEKIKNWTEGKEVQDVVFVPGRLINIILKD